MKVLWCLIGRRCRRISSTSFARITARQRMMEQQSALQSTAA
jgi:hypothetical protein